MERKITITTLIPAAAPLTGPVQVIRSRSSFRSGPGFGFLAAVKTFLSSGSVVLNESSCPNPSLSPPVKCSGGSDDPDDDVTSMTSSHTCC